MRLDDLVQEHYEHMSASDRRVWQYICRHKEECRKMTLHELADACEVSHTTVSRFLQLIGMDGYNEFKAFLKWDSFCPPVFNERSIEENSFNLNRTISSIQQADCSELFYRMEHARGIYAYGSGAVQKSAAKAMKGYLLLAKKLLHVIEGAEERIMAMQQMSEGDVVFLFSLSGNNSAMNEYARKLKDSGMYLTAICQDGANELSKLCHFCLPFFTQKIDIDSHGLSFHSSAGMLLIAEILMLKYTAYQTARHRGALSLE
ncbi:MAG: MurR/RpiR family transcriptional regulator [Lachnospiraceae bacterium]|jgi:RpiR family glv operon transcriptional regulator|nr:MurR/RpiR family transcriptional regulator [Lachnospiraceae bacterium]